MPTNFNNLGATTTVESESTKIFNFMAFSADGEPAYLTLNENYLINQLSNLTPENNIPDIWEKVIVTYKHPSTPQFKALTFRRENFEFKCITSWSAYAYVGTWNVSKVYIVNKDGSLSEFDGLDFSGDDITIS